MKRNIFEMRDRLQQQQQMLSKIEQQWLELEKRLAELEARLPVFPEMQRENANVPRKPR